MKNYFTNNELLNKIFSSNERELKKLNQIAEKIENLSSDFERLSDSDILGKSSELKRRINSGEKLNDILPEAFALVSESIRRQFGFKPHKVQLMGAISLFEGKGVEMRTGEGKTITAIFPAYLHALTGEPVHIMTSNDYLAKRDAETVSPIFKSLGISVGAIDSSLSRDEKKVIYKSNVVYGTTSNFGFDFLRDNLVYTKEDKFTNGLGFAIVDEADSLLLDQARTPLILSGTGQISKKEEELIKIATEFANTLSDNDVEIDEDKKTAYLSGSGADKAEKFFNANFQTIFDNYIYYINKALTAKFALKIDVDYIVKNGKIVLIDKNTARPLPTHRFSEGLHQAVESKEHLVINPESNILGRITIQNFLRKYKKLSGMSGTIKTSEEELKTIYGLDVVQIPTNKPVLRKDDTLIYFFAKEKYDAIIKDIIETHKKGQPVLIGTTSIEESEMLKTMLDEIGINCEILNAKNLSREAKIIANAGRFGAVTIATDMAGRGTDIKLGGNAEVLADIASKSGLNIPFDEIKNETKENRSKVIAVGGLKVIGSSLHTLVRVDGQLRGRSGRQGEIGESVFYSSLDDKLFDDYPEIKDGLRSDLIKYMQTKNAKIKDKILHTIESIQNRNESIDFSSRKDMITYDREPSKQYDEFYKLRNEVLETDDITIIIENASGYLAQNIVDCAIKSSTNPELKDDNYLRYKSIFNRFNIGEIDYEKIKPYYRDEIVNKLTNKIINSFNKTMINNIGKVTLLKTMDSAFIDHLKNIDSLKKDVSLYAYSESNPLMTFEEKSHQMYNEMIDNILAEVVMQLIERTPRPLQFGKFSMPTK